MIYDPKPIRDGPVGAVGDFFQTVTGGINPGDIRVRSRVVGFVYMCVDGLRSWHGTLSSPDDGYFMYHPWPMSDPRSDEKAILRN